VSTDNDQPDPVLAAWPALDAPDDFQQRVMGRLESLPATPPARSRRPLYLGAALATLATAAAVLFTLAPVDSTHLAQARESVTLGRRGIAVLEAGADVHYRVGWGGAAEITQRSGNVFYRVERGGPFVVHTPAGDVTVHGTCFRVEVSDMKAVKSGLVGASVGAALTAAVFVTVFEGKVSLANPRGQVALAAGDRAAASGADAPHAVADKQAAATTPPAPVESLANMSPAELQKRAEEQRTEIIGLHDQVRKLRADLDSAHAALEGNKGEKRRGFELEPSKEELAEMAKTCTLKWDSPEMGAEPQKIGPKMRETFKLSPPEAESINKAAVQLDDVARGLRALYVEVTGDRAHAESMT
jgi:hypothetical protein